MNLPVSRRLLDATLADARTQLVAAQATDITDHLAVIRSHAALTAIVARLLWTLEPDGDPDVAAQVDAEDGVSRPVYVRFNRERVAA